MAVIPFDVGEDIVDLITENMTTIRGLTYKTGVIEQEDGIYDDCVTIYTGNGIRSEKEVRKLDECEREYLQYTANFKRAV